MTTARTPTDLSAGITLFIMAIDSKSVFIGTYNFNPRPENLSTEVDVIVHDEPLARALEAAIEIDMAPGNSWGAATDNPDQYLPFCEEKQNPVLPAAADHAGVVSANRAN